MARTPDSTRVLKLKKVTITTATQTLAELGIPAERDVVRLKLYPADDTVRCEKDADATSASFALPEAGIVLPSNYTEMAEYEFYAATEVTMGVVVEG